MTDLIFGIHTVQALVTRAPQRLRQVYLLESRDDQRQASLLASLNAHGITTTRVSRQWLDDKTQGGVHQGIAASLRQVPSYQEGDLDSLLTQLENPFLLLLDGVTDPHNLGACLRTAEAAGVDAVIVPKDRSAALNATARKVASGAAEMIPFIRVTNLARTLRLLQHYAIRIIGTAGEASCELYQAKLIGPTALVMGAEGTGLRRLTRQHCDQLVSIPLAGSVTSLNVSVATGVCLFEIVRQRALVVPEV